MREFYRFQARVPEVISLLDQKASNLSTFLGDFDGSKPSIDLELAEAAVLVRSLAKNSTGDARAAATQLALRLERDRATHEADARQLWVAIRTLLLTYRQAQSDRRWEPK